MAAGRGRKGQEMAIDFNRYAIQRHYHGKFDDIDTICACMAINEAAEICALLNEKYSDRPITFTVKKTAKDYIDFLDDENYKPE